MHHGEALQWLEAQPILAGCSMITSMPDYSEFPSWSLEQWKLWFVRSARMVMEKCPDDGVAIFYQRDRKREGCWVDKAFLIQKAAEEIGMAQLWHKIVCRAPPGNTTFGSPAYSHLLCFSKGIREELQKSTMDILPQAGKTTWTRGMGTQACQFACKFILANTASHTIVDPFCGHGTVLSVANQLGLHAIGVELSRKRAEKASELHISLLK